MAPTKSSPHLPRCEKHSIAEEKGIAEALIQSEAGMARTFVHSAEAIGTLSLVAHELAEGKLRLRDALRDGDEAGRGEARARGELVTALREIARGASRLDEPACRAVLEEELVALRLHRRVLDRICDAVPANHPTAAISARARARADQCKAALVTANLHVAVGMAKRFRRPAIDPADLVQEGTIGLMRACDKYDPARGHRFGTYAGFWVRQQISRGLVEHVSAIRVPLQMTAARHRAARTQRSFAAAHGRAPTSSELAVASGLGAKVVDTIRALPGEPLSLHATSGDGETELMARVADPTVARADHSLEFERLKEGIRDLLGKLTRREAEILTLRFGLDDHDEMTLREIGDRFHLSRERVRRIEEAALGKLVVFLRAKGISGSAAA